jgi:hypothetical protein
LSHARLFALASLAAALVVYGAVAEQLPDLPTNLDVVVECLVVFPTFAWAIWLALPLARRSHGVLLGAFATCGALALGLAVLGLGSASNVAKLAAFALLGFWFVSLFDDLWWVATVALVIPWVDIWSVAAGPTKYVVEQRQGVFQHVAIAFPIPGEGATINLGPPDVVFFSLFLAAAARFGLRVTWTWIAMTGLLSLTLALVWKLELSGLPALPAVALGFLAPNADLVWRNIRTARAAARTR